MEKNLDSGFENVPNEKEKISQLLKKADDLVSDSPQESIEYSRKALQSADKFQLFSQKETALYLLALANHYLGKYKEALKYYLKSYKILQQFQRKENIAASANNIGSIFLSLRNFDEAWKYFHEALHLNLKIGDKKAIANSYHNLALVYRKKNDFKNALQYNLKALKIRRNLDDEKDLLSSLNNTAINYDCLNNFDKALDLYLQALKICEENPNEQQLRSKLLNNLGIVYRRLHNFDKAFQYHRQALKIKEKIGDKIGISYTYNNIGSVYFAQNNFQKALSYYEKALTIKQEIGAENEYVFSFVLLGTIHAKLGEIDKALEFYFKALEIEKKSQNRYGEIIALNNIGSLFLEKKELDEAEKYFLQMMKLSQNIDDKLILKEQYENFSKLYTAKNEFRQALDYYRKFITLKDEIFSEQMRNKIIEIEMKFETEKKEKEAEIFRLKNVELLNLNETLKTNMEKQKHLLDELRSHREHLNLINKILRHDLINAFAIVRSAIRIFQETQKAEILNEALKHIDSSVMLIRRMKALETMVADNAEMKKYDVRKILKKIIARYPSIKYNISGNCEIMADEAIVSVFENIIRNSIQHGKTTRMDIELKDYLDISHLKFSDYGKGIPNSIKEKIFEEGFKYGKKGNLGLGMFIIKKTIERYGGKVEVKDNIPFGTSVILTIFKPKK